MIISASSPDKVEGINIDETTTKTIDEVSIIDVDLPRLVFDQLNYLYCISELLDSSLSSSTTPS